MTHKALEKYPESHIPRRKTYVILFLLLFAFTRCRGFFLNGEGRLMVIQLISACVPGYFWWLVSHLSGFFPQNFGRWQGPTNDGSAWKWMQLECWGHSMATCCLKKYFLHSQWVRKNFGHEPFALAQTSPSHGETFTSYFQIGREVGNHSIDSDCLLEMIWIPG